MATIQAKFENGVFKPVGRVDLPEHCDVEFEPRVVLPRPSDVDIDAIYEVLGRRHESGVRDTAERHNEHQP